MSLIQIKTSKQSSQLLSKAQKRFNTLSKKAEKLKSRLLEWQNDFPPVHQKLSREYNELFGMYNGYRLELLRLLDGAHDARQVTKTERKKLKQLIMDVVDELIIDNDSDEVKALHDKYHEVSHKVKSQAADEMTKSLLEGMFGVDFGDDFDLNSPEDMQRKVQEYTEQQQARTRKRKPSAKQIATEQRQQEETQNVRKSLQEVYRKLAAVLHPDREPDPASREHKTQLMQRANHA